jgi:hypothetical protein
MLAAYLRDLDAFLSACALVRDVEIVRGRLRCPIQHDEPCNTAKMIHVM